MAGGQQEQEAEVAGRIAGAVRKQSEREVGLGYTASVLASSQSFLLTVSDALPYEDFTAFPNRVSSRETHVQTHEPKRDETFHI